MDLVVKMAWYDNLWYNNNEVATKKSLSLLDFGKDSSQYSDNRDLSSSSVLTSTDSRSFSTQTSSVFNPIDNRSLSLVINSAGASNSIKKDISSRATPSFSNTPSTSISPSQTLSKVSKNLQGLTSGLDVGKYLTFGGLAVGGYFILTKTPFGRKILGRKK